MHTENLRRMQNVVKFEVVSSKL